ncbi:hypothetical protein BCR43DRAFT_505548 [Syncephalastrum racemosum]|uniref:UspA domain-containing protein n=1 Tax=Syncephalastrum racemosum TaxID=13706 RepID=A0A1X2HD57_SYNRA|nr:hypothetical protein BCR43DRAFT_505548 [Syncephalastrum racemosum]
MDQSLLLPTEFFPEPRKKTPGTEPEPAPRRVVIAYDQTRYNDALLDRVIRTGLLDPDDRIHLVHVVSQNDIKTFLNRIAGATSGVEANLYASIQGATDLHANALASAAEDLLLAVAKVLRDHSFHYVKTEVVHGDPKQTIMDYCHCVHPDFLMTGSKGSNISSPWLHF